MVTVIDKLLKEIGEGPHESRGYAASGENSCDGAGGVGG